MHGLEAKAEAEKKRDAEKQKGEAGKANSTEQEDKAASEAAKKHSTLEEQLEDAEVQLVGTEPSHARWNRAITVIHKLLTTGDNMISADFFSIRAELANM
eukprot:6312065-Amphidinium_carterae.1